jgi:hypothetical protein
MDFDRAMDLVATCLQPPTLTQRRVAGARLLLAA